jgi:hypothetical protein
MGQCAGGSANAKALGDFDGDGFDDFMLSVYPNIDAELVDSREAFLFYGGAERIQTGATWASVAARLEAPQGFHLSATGDINADGLGDVVLGSYWLPGREARLSGTVHLPSIAASSSMLPIQAVGDLDGDGVNEVLVLEDGLKPYLFYGTTGLFDDGVDLAQAAARFEPYPGPGFNLPDFDEQYYAERFAFTTLTAVQDRDGDGDDELVASRLIGNGGVGSSPQLVALFSGTAARLDGDVALPAPSSPIPDPDPEDLRQEFVEVVFPVGDLDGDGAADLVTRSHWYRFDGNGAFEPFYDEAGFNTYDSNEGWLNIHYGTPGGELQTPPR